MNRTEFDEKCKVHLEIMTIDNIIDGFDLFDEYIHSLEKQNQGLKSLLYLKQQEISVLESKDSEVKTCGSCRTCFHSGAYVMGWMSCMNENVGIMFTYGVNDNFGCIFYRHMHDTKQN